MSIIDDYVLTSDTRPARWIIWDGTTFEPVSSGWRLVHDQGGDRFLTIEERENVEINQVEVRQIPGGELLGTFSAVFRQAGLAADGSYAWTASTTELVLWRIDGQQIATRNGAYGNSRIFADAGELRIVNGPSGTNVVEHVNAENGASVVGSPFNGTFAAHFLDGTHFLTTVDDIVMVYDSNDAMVELVTAPADTAATEHGGVRDLFWSGGSIFEIGTDTAVATVTPPSFSRWIATPEAIAVVSRGPGTLTVTDLTSPTFDTTAHEVPASYLESFAGSASRWMVGNRYGVVYLRDAAAQEGHNLGYGRAFSLAGADDGTVALATAAVGVSVFDAHTGALDQTIPFLSTRVGLSRDGDVLAYSGSTYGAQYYTESSLHVVGLPGLTPIMSWDYVFPELRWFTLADDGLRIGQSTAVAGLDANRIINLDTQAVELSEPGEPEILHVSPDGAAATLTRTNGWLQGGSTTRFFVDGTLVNAAVGYSLGFVAPEQVVLVGEPEDTEFGGGGDASVYNTYGNLLYDSPLTVDDFAPIGDGANLIGYLPLLDPISASIVYSPGAHQIYDLTTGTTLPWPERVPNTSAVGTVAGDFIVHPTCGGRKVAAIPHGL